MVTAEDVIELHTLLTQHKIDIWIDGGWGVDALLGRQTSPHNDLDIALKHSDVAALRKLLEMRGIRMYRATTPANATSRWAITRGVRLMSIRSSLMPGATTFSACRIGPSI